MFSFKALATSSSQRPEGYEAALYYHPEASLPNMQLDVAQVGENANWRLCMDSTMRPPSQTKVKEELRRLFRFVFRNIIFVFDFAKFVALQLLLF